MESSNNILKVQSILTVDAGTIVSHSIKHDRPVMDSPAK